jgi:hypothetical protein
MNSRISAEDAARRSTADGPVNTHTSVLANIALEADHDCISHSQTDRDISRTHGQGNRLPAKRFTPDSLEPKVREVLEASSAAPGNRSGQGRGAE